MIKDLLTRRGAMRTAGAAVLTTMGMAAKSRPSNEVECLWEARAALMGRYCNAREAYYSADAMLPDWARPGLQHLNSKGERCGPEVGWPELPNVNSMTLPDPGRLLVIRPIARGPSIPEAVTDRLRERDEFRERVGWNAASKAIDECMEELSETEMKILNLRDGASPAWLAAAAIVEIGQETTLDNTINDANGVYFHRFVLEAVVDQLSGRIASDTKAILAGAPFCQIGCYC